jgi:hypothetical protein
MAWYGSFEHISVAWVMLVSPGVHENIAARSSGVEFVNRCKKED